MRYVEADIPSDDKDIDDEEVNTGSSNAANKHVEPTPKKKRRVSRKQNTDTKLEDSEKTAVKGDNVQEKRKSKSVKKEAKNTNKEKKNKGRKGRNKNISNLI